MFWLRKRVGGLFAARKPASPGHNFAAKWDCLVTETKTNLVSIHETKGTMKKILLAAFLGAVIFFVWSAVLHMNPVTAPMGLSLLNEKEAAVLAAVKANVPQPGLYFFPGFDMSKTLSKEDQDAWNAKYKAGPSGLLLVQPPGGDPMMVGQLVESFCADLVCAGIAAFILSSTVGSYRRRVVIVTALGVFSWMAISIQQLDWYNFPFTFIALDGINQVIGWALAGLLMAKMIKAPSQSAR